MKSSESMKYLALEIKTQTSSFRIPEFQKYQKSYALPPPTTLMGFAGAAMGLTPKEAQQFFENSSFVFGVYGKSKGKARDLWKYWKYDDNKVQHSILRREILFLNRFVIVYGTKDTGKIKKLKLSFSNPSYALTLGASDSLTKVKIIDNFSVNESREVNNCILRGNVIKDVLENSENSCDFSIYQTREPLTYNVPIKFDYEWDYGIRRVVKRAEFSFIPKPMTLNTKKQGIRIQDIFVPFFPID